MIGAVLLVAVVLGATLSYKRLDDFINATTGHHINPLGEVVQAVEAQPGTIAYKLQHGQQVNILLLGMGGYENDAPFLTDSIMAVHRPASNRVMMLSIPRDRWPMNLQDPRPDVGQQDQRRLRGPVHQHHLLRAKILGETAGPRGGARGREDEWPDVRQIHRVVDFVVFRDMVNVPGGATSAYDRPRRQHLS
jgi:hypothetical protein